ncbi:MAG: hypothetical protein HFH75_04245 [Lachnospiraceae bacterium]|nr:hypothetical protein [Lachnospiraceae bacterium]
MRRAIVTAMAVSALMAGGMGGCQGDLSAQAPEMENVVSDIKAQAAEELRRAFSQEVSDFFKSDDLSKALGDDGEGQAKLEESIRSFIDDYSTDEEKLSEAKASLDSLLQNAEGLSAEEIQDRIEGIFQK